jgi:DNA replication ATP-dependent helicase Dna2
VKQVQPGTHSTDGNRSREEIVLLAQAEGTTRLVAITLRDSWSSAIVNSGDIIHVADAPSTRSHGTHVTVGPAGQVVIDDSDESPFLIVHPDHMLSATTVADSFDCARKAVLQNLIKATGETSKAMVYGSILHEIFQVALSANQWDSPFLDSTIERSIQAHVEGLWELGMRDLNLAIEEIKAKMAEMAAWASAFVAAKPSKTALVEDRQGEKIWMSISKLIAIEEHIWSPMYGLKGNIDATIEAHLIDHPEHPGKKLVLPFEVKTGRTTQSPAHRAQTALYTLLLSDRYDVSVTAGILYYLESSSIYRVAPPIREVRQMIQQRNRLAMYIFRARHPHQNKANDQPDALASQVVEGSDLPNLLKTPFKCNKCYAQQSCFTYHALKENGTAETAGMADDNKKNHSLVWQEAVGHLLQSRTQDAGRVETLRRWYTKWDRLLTFEEGDQFRMRKELWTMSSAERQRVGRCFGNLILKHDGSTSTRAAGGDVDGVGGKINRYTHSFIRAAASDSASFMEATQLVVGEPIVVSSEQGQWALANGYVMAVTQHELQVAVDRKLGDARGRLRDFDDQSNQAFRGIMNASGVPQVNWSEGKKPLLYRVDKDEFSNGLALVRNNLLTLMSPHPIHTKLREQIVFGAPPTFTTTSTSGNAVHESTMNDDQRKAVNTVLSANDFALILGMPGTGKTTTIAQLIKGLLAEKKSILLTSFTHTAVDNILLKIRDIAPPGSILRLGAPAKINPYVQEFCLLASANPPRATIDEIEAAYMGTSIVAATCMGTNHALFNRRTFDVCIVDEASQITLPTILGPLLRARKFVLVGDHFQLPPLVQNRIALEGGLDESLFRMLCQREENKLAVVELGCQYRMCEEIMSLSNQLIYSGRLSCGDEQVASRTMQLSHLDGLAAVHGETGVNCGFAKNQCWLVPATNAESKVLFLNTDLLGQAADEYLDDGTKNITNPAEASLCLEAVLALLAQGVRARDIGIITPYRSQVALFRRLLRAVRHSQSAHTPLRISSVNEVEVDTPDRYQGRDKEVIVISLVRSNKRGDVGELLRDARRVNVALTRARSKLILVGSKATLRTGSDLFSGVLNIIDEASKSGGGMSMLNVPKDALEGHVGLGNCASQNTFPMAKEICSPSPKKKKASFLDKTTNKKRQVEAEDYPNPKRARHSQDPPVRDLSDELGNGGGAALVELSPNSVHSGSAHRKPHDSQKHKDKQEKSPKIISRHASQLGGKMKKMKEALAIEIWEDLIGEDDDIDDF